MKKNFITLGCFVLALILGFLLAWPEYQSWQSVQSNVASSQAALNSKQLYFDEIKEVSKKLTQYQESIDKVSSALPSEPSLANLFEFFQKSSAEAGLIMETINLGDVAAPKQSEEFDFREISIGLELLGRYDSFKYFLAVIHNSSRIFEVESFSLTPPKEDETDFTYNIVVKTHSY